MGTAPIGRRITAWYTKFAAFKVEDLFSRKKEPGPRRTIFFNENLPADYHDAHGKVKPEHIYATNQVITSKYTVITFLPRNLLEQFRRIANMYVRHFFFPRKYPHSQVYLAIASLIQSVHPSFFLDSLVPVC
jgi:hypothetical protein